MAVVVALFAAARTPEAFIAIVAVGQLPKTFDEIVELPYEFAAGSQALFCHDLRSTLDLPDLVAMAAPVKIRGSYLGVLN